MDSLIEGKSYRLVVQRSPLKDKDGNLSEMNSGGWSARWQRDRVGLETERELTGGVHVKTHHDSLGGPLPNC